MGEIKECKTCKWLQDNRCAASHQCYRHDGWEPKEDILDVFARIYKAR